jgi:hypothetical protein
VLGTFREFLEGIEIVQEPAARFVARVDHRYDRLLPPARSAVAPDDPARPRASSDPTD